MPQLINSWGENQVGVVGHDYSGVQVISKGVIVTNRFKDDVARPLRQDPSISGNERDEMPFSVSLQVRQVAPVERHSQSFHVSSR